MRRRSVLVVVLALLAAAFVVMATRPAVSRAAAAVRVMPLGDSITGSPGCWRALLWNRLQNTGFTDIDFVGTLPPQGCGVAHDGDNEGHGGFLATNIASQNVLPGWLAATRPDVVLMHLGTNDVWNNRSPQQILGAFTTLVNQMRASNPNMRILVAQIIPMNPSNCPDCGNRVVAFNAAIPGWASGLSTARSPITVVDQWTGFSTAADTTDGVHPNGTTGIQKMSDRWYPALAAVLGGVIPSPGPSTPSPSSPSPSSPGPVGCTATVSLNQWQGGFVATVRVTAGPVAVNGWAVSLTLPSGATISNAWNARRSGDTGAVRFTNMDYNGRVGAGQFTEFGFQSSGTGSGLTPSCTPS
jgi:lysophospholipase L1-like esterase